MKKPIDSYFLPFVYKMEDIFKNEGDDYSKYSENSKKCIASCVSIAVSIKAVLDTQILTDDGLLTDESSNTVVSTEQFINSVVLPEIV